MLPHFHRFAPPLLALTTLCVCVFASPANAESPATPAKAKVSGIDPSLISSTISPGENFYLYANERWLETTEIPSDKADYGIFTVLADQTRVQVRALIEAAAEEQADQGSPAQKVGDLYRSVLATESRNQAGLDPVRPLLESILSAGDKRELAGVMGTLMRQGVGGPLVAYVYSDAKDSDQYIVYLTQSGLTLPDRDYYREDQPNYVKLRGELFAYVTEMLTQCGVDNPSAQAFMCVQLEQSIANAQWTNTENRDPVKTYNRTSAEELAASAGQFAISEMLEKAGLGAESELVVRQPSYLKQLGKFWDAYTLSQWKAYLMLRTIDAYAGSLSESLEKRHFAFHNTAVKGITEQKPLWERGVNTTGSVLGELVGQLYVEKHFTAEAKQRMNQLVENLKQAFRKRIESLTWMGEGTKRQALQKLSKFTTKIGYPDQWKDYSALQIGDGVLAENLIAAAEFEHRRDLEKLGGPVDRNEWHMTPQTINAYYSPLMNEIVFPAAILQPPFFNMAADDAVNYGGIGAVIGHELSHGFDDKGSKYDGNGNLRNWWTEEDRSEFEARAAGLVKQYTQFTPLEGAHVNGELTLGENIGDLGGLSVAHAAYRLSLRGGDAPVIDGLTGDQRFFMGWGQIWRRLYREPELRRRLIVDPHSPSEYRVNGIVRNMDAWYQAFDIPHDSELFLAPEERVRIW
ncbi:MAG: M13 family metallopeptidase [Planctomycetota bacterium]